MRKNKSKVELSPTTIIYFTTYLSYNCGLFTKQTASETLKVWETTNTPYQPLRHFDMRLNHWKNKPWKTSKIVGQVKELY